MFDLFSTLAGSLAQKSWDPVGSNTLCTLEWKSWSPETFIVRATQYIWIASPQWTYSFTWSHGYWNVSKFGELPAHVYILLVLISTDHVLHCSLIAHFVTCTLNVHLVIWRCTTFQIYNPVFMHCAHVQCILNKYNQVPNVEPGCTLYVRQVA